MNRKIHDCLNTTFEKDYRVGCEVIPPIITSYVCHIYCDTPKTL